MYDTKTCLAALVLVLGFISLGNCSRKQVKQVPQPVAEEAWRKQWTPREQKMIEKVTEIMNKDRGY